MDTTQYLNVFIDESAEHLDTLYNQLLQLEKNPADNEVIDEIFRAAHTIKGMSATMGYHDVANLTHHLENTLDGIRNGSINVNAELIDRLFHATDHLNQMVEDIANGGTGSKNIQHLLKDLDQEKANNENEDQGDQHLLPSNAFTQLDEFEIAILNESTTRGYNNYEITVQISEECLLKGARVFMVFEVLEKVGEVIKSIPSVSELEEEEFDDSFSVLLISKHDRNELEANINKVSEIKDVAVKRFSVKANQQQHDEDHHTNNAEKTDQQEHQQLNQTRLSSPRKTIRVNIERLDILMNLFEELVINRGKLEQISSELNHSDLQETVERISRVSNDLQNIVLNMRMIPIDQVFNRFPGMVRQLARELDKDIAIEIIGAETELDRTVIDEIGNPLVHLIRNAIDHGIEMPDERRVKGKSEQGKIQLAAYHSGNHVFIEIKDDGAGIDQQKVLTKAIANGVVTEEQSTSLTDEQIYELILVSGFSTTDNISDISGRGVGLDVVKNTIESLGGSITIQSTIDQGSMFSVQLPLTLSIISVLLVKLQDEKYAIPLTSIIETTVIHKESILSAHHKKVIDFRGEIVPLVDLNHIFSLPTAEDNEFVSVVIVKRGDQRAGLIVDSFIGQQEVVLKSLGNYLSDIFAISGATILGDGEVALIIDSNSLVKQF